MKNEAKLVPLKEDNSFKAILTSDLVFDPTWPIFEPDWDIVKMIIVSKFDEVWTKTGLYRVHKVFLWFDLVT